MLGLLLEIISVGILQTYGLDRDLLEHLLFSFGVDFFCFGHSIDLFFVNVEILLEGVVVPEIFDLYRFS